MDSFRVTSAHIRERHFPRLLRAEWAAAGTIGFRTPRAPSVLIPAVLAHKQQGAGLSSPRGQPGMQANGGSSQLALVSCVCACVCACEVWLCVLQCVRLWGVAVWGVQLVTGYARVSYSKSLPSQRGRPPEGRVGTGGVGVSGIIGQLRRGHRRAWSQHCGAEELLQLSEAISHVV